jgi:D-arabinose 1-dehydrogenase-like Zn-dependent alcohol dehydrogenase
VQQGGSRQRKWLRWERWSTDRLERVNDIFREMKQGRIGSRIVLQF